MVALKSIEVIQERNHHGICLSCREMGSWETAGAVSDVGEQWQEIR